VTADSDFPQLSTAADWWQWPGSPDVPRAIATAASLKDTRAPADSRHRETHGHTT